MAFVFVQFWGPLTTINEVFMGDTPPTSQPAGNFSNIPQGTRSNVSQPLIQSQYSENEAMIGSHAPSAHSPQTGYPPAQAYSSQQHVQHARPESFNMVAVGNALPDLAYQGYAQVSPQRYPQGPAPPGLLYQIQNVPQYTGAQNVSSSSATYNMPYQGQYQTLYGATHTGSPQHLQLGPAPAGQFYHNQGFVGQPQQQGSPYPIQSNQYGSQGQMYSGSPSQYGMRGGFSGDSRLPGQQRPYEYLSTSTTGPTGRSSSIGKYETVFK